MVTGNSKFHIKNRLLLKNVFSMKYQKYLISQVHKQQQGHGKKYWDMHIKITFLINMMQNVPLSFFVQSLFFASPSRHSGKKGSIFLSHFSRTFCKFLSNLVKLFCKFMAILFSVKKFQAELFYIKKRICHGFFVFVIFHVKLLVNLDYLFRSSYMSV